MVRVVVGFRLGCKLVLGFQLVLVLRVTFMGRGVVIYQSP